MSEGGENIPSGTEPTSSQQMVDKGDQNIAPGKEGTRSQKMADIKKDLFKKTTKGRWCEVVEIYRNHPEAHKSQITMLGDTALHVAVSENKEQIVKALIELIVAPPEGKANLKIQNKRGNTPLHYAAAEGSVCMCKLIVDADSSSLDVENIQGETPSFVAAFYDKKEAFIYLHNKSKKELRHARRLDGNTILHCTIARDYFDLAFQIIHLCGEMLVDRVNEEGMLPLHLLASKPSAFKSGYQMGLLTTIIYNGIFVDELKVEVSDHQSNNEKNQNNKENVNSQKSSNYPHIYTTCLKFFHFLDNLLETVFCFKCKKQPDEENPGVAGYQGSEIVPPNLGFTKRAMEFLGLGPTVVGKIRNAKKKHMGAVQTMNKLLELTSMYEDDVATGRSPPQDAKDETRPYSFENDQVKMASENIDQHSAGEDKGQNIKKGKKLHGETPLLLAVKHGIIEIVKKILVEFPIAKYDRNEDQKNILLLAAENRQPLVYQLLLQKPIKTEMLFQRVDKDGNGILHLAAKLGVHKPWQIAGAALQMQWEFKWYEFVKESIPPQFHIPRNDDGETPTDLFSKTHEKLIKDGSEWLTKTSESCSVVAALIAGVAFATSSTFPGGVKEKSGTPTLENQPAFSVFAITSLLALCFSVMALILFLAILTSRFREKDFAKQLPRRLLIGLTSLFISIASMLVSFCAGHFFVLKDELKYATIPVYAVTCLPVTYFVVAQLPLYFDVIFATFRKIPKRSREVVEF